MKFIYHYAFKRTQDPAVLESAGTALDKVYATDSRLGIERVEDDCRNLVRSTAAV